MIVESNYPVTIETLSDWLKNLAPILQPMESKTKSKGTLLRTCDLHAIFPAL